MKDLHAPFYKASCLARNGQQSKWHTPRIDRICQTLHFQTAQTVKKTAKKLVDLPSDFKQRQCELEAIVDALKGSSSQMASSRLASGRQTSAPSATQLPTAQQQQMAWLSDDASLMMLVKLTEVKEKLRKGLADLSSINVSIEKRPFDPDPKDKDDRLFYDKMAKEIWQGDAGAGAALHQAAIEAKRFAKSKTKDQKEQEKPG
eukprot:TRINITY_DN270_c0_g1_i2.p1 TRINITY_DN270_c0_g1~~TRINITY_DN270_c0_g1_i2.p1  ORF type:complete len:203 (-),score=43.41 TRINITY_DN270_c0_g1_i2:214-822(-)